MKTSPPLFVLLLALVAPLNAGSRTSGSYTIPADVADAGGRRAVSASYTNDGSAEGIVGVSSLTSPSETMKHGYAGQLYDIVGLSVTAPPSDSLNEGASRQLQAAPLADDATTLAAFAPSTVTWSILSGPISTISSSGLATAAIVYQNTAATIGGSAQGLNGQFALTILNVNIDDFGSYAGDGIDDSWQVQYFGQPPNPNAAPNVDFDGTGQTNLFKFIAGLNPLDPTSRFAISIAPVPGQSTQKYVIFTPLAAGRTYTVTYKGALSAPLWNILPGVTFTDNGSQRTVTDPNATDAKKFYHVEITKP